MQLTNNALCVEKIRLPHPAPTLCVDGMHTPPPPTLCVDKMQSARQLARTLFVYKEMHTPPPPTLCVDKMRSARMLTTTNNNLLFFPRLHPSSPAARSRPVLPSRRKSWAAYTYTKRVLKPQDKNLLGKNISLLFFWFFFPPRADAFFSGARS